MKKFFVIWGAGFAILMAVLLVITIRLLGIGAIRGAIRSTVVIDLYRIQRSLSQNTDVRATDGIIYVLYDEDGTILANNIDNDIPMENVTEIIAAEKNVIINNSHEKSMHFETIDGKLYSIKTMTYGNLSQKYGKDVALTGIMHVDLVENVYFTFCIWIVCGVVIVTIIMLIILNIGGRQFSKSLDTITSGAEKIGEKMDFSTRINNNVGYPEVKSLIDAHNRLLDRVEDIMSSQRNYGRNLSHELRTPIGIISAQCQVLKDKYEDDATLMEYVERIERQNNQMRDLISQLLILSRLDDSTQKEQVDDIMLDEVIEFLCKDIEESKNMNNIFALHLEPLSVRANMSYLVILIENLITNALKYGMSDEPIDVTLTHNGNLIRVEVADHGDGITEDEENKVFEAYYRNDDNNKVEGYGLGLTLAKKIAAHYGGDVTVKSSQGTGCTFTAEFNLFLI